MTDKKLTDEDVVEAVRIIDRMLYGPIEEANNDG